MNTRRPKREHSVWERATVADPHVQAARERSRRRLGVLLGALLGFVYGGVSQLINPIALPGISLYQPPAGAFGNILLNGLMGGVLGALACFPTSAARGIVLGCVAALIGILTSMIARLDGLGLGGALISSVILSAPMAWLTAPVIAVLRWAAERQVDALRNDEPFLTRAVVPVALVLTMAFLAGFELLPADSRNTLRQANALIQDGFRSTFAAELPAPLRSPAITVYPTSSGGGYTLEWTQYDLDRFMELRPPSNFDQHAAVIARFASGYLLVCLYPTPKQEPNCANYDRMPAKSPARGDD